MQPHRANVIRKRDNAIEKKKKEQKTSIYLHKKGYPNDLQKYEKVPDFPTANYNYHKRSQTDRSVARMKKMKTMILERIQSKRDSITLLVTM